MYTKLEERMDLSNGCLYRGDQGRSRYGEGTLSQGYAFLRKLNVKQVGLPVH